MRLTDIWRWLPVFRAVADAESVSRAATSLGISPPAVSKTIRQLETNIGQTLFDRASGRLTLNPHGERLLHAVRESELRIEEVLSGFSHPQEGGLIRLATVGQLDRVFILPAVRVLAERMPKLQISIGLSAPEEALANLESGTVELFLALNVTAPSSVRTIELGEIAMGVFAGRGHPLFEQPTVSLEELLEHQFVAQSPIGLMKPVWPRDLKRNVALTASTHALALDTCLAGSHLMVMEVVTAAPWVTRGELRELSPELLPKAHLRLFTHVRDDQDLVTKTVVDAIREAVDGVRNQA